MPPARAIAIAILDSVTVSIAELTSGTFSRIFLVSWLEVSAVAGTTSEAAGSSSTSSNVSPSIATLVGSSPPVGTGTAMGMLLSAIDMGGASSHRHSRGARQLPDPFADDPCDPSAALDALEPGQPLDPQERTAVEADLADLAVYEALLAHKGIRGLVVCCEECQQDHYHDWDMLRANLLQLLVDGTVRPHEPAYDPEPDAYVTWDYCRGYADASLNEATSDTDYR
jgi:hypothetical protein